MTNPLFTQVAYRIRNDNGTEGTGSGSATWRAAQDTENTIIASSGSNTNFRVRFLIDETNSRAWTNKTWNLYYSVASASSAYNPVSDTTPIQFRLSDYFIDGDDCTSQLTGGAGAFLTNNNGMKETTGGAVNTGAAGNYFETEWSLIVDPAQVTSASTFNLQIYDNTSPINAYTKIARINVNKVASITTACPVQVQTSASLALTQHGKLTSACPVQAHTSASVAVTYHPPNWKLTSACPVQVQTSGSFALTQHNKLTSACPVQIQQPDNIILTNHPPNWKLTSACPVQTQTAGSVIITAYIPNWKLISACPIQIQQSDNLVLSGSIPNWQLTTACPIQLQLADNIVLASGEEIIAQSYMLTLMAT